MLLARRVLLDALEALAHHRDALVLVGAQAIYLHTGAADVALPETTNDSDLAVDRRRLTGAPPVEEAMADAGFERGTDPGSWIGAMGTPVDLMVPAAMSDPGGRRGARVPPHAKWAMRRASGLEAAIVDHAPMHVAALDALDPRRFTIEVAGPAALLVAKLHKLGERDDHTRGRRDDKDAHDIYRLLVAVPTQILADRLDALRSSELASSATRVALAYLDDLFAGPHARGARMAGRAEEHLGDPATVAQSAAALAGDLACALGRTTARR